MYSDPELGFIDIGANIGLYSLVALAMGHTVLAVEPFQVKIPHLRKMNKKKNLT